MKPLSGPSEAHRTKNGTFKQSYRPIVVVGQQSAAGPQFIQEDPPDIIQTESDLRTWSFDTSRSSRKQYWPGGTFPQTILGPFRSLSWYKHYRTALTIAVLCLALKHLRLDLKQSVAEHSDMGLRQRTTSQHIKLFKTDHFIPELYYASHVWIEVKQPWKTMSNY